jgi:subtilisin family serine protease
MEPDLWEVFESGSADDEVGVIIRMAPDAEPPSLVRVVCRFEDVYTARIRRGDIVQARQSPGVISLKASTKVTQPRPLESGVATAAEPTEDEFFDAETVVDDEVEEEGEEEGEEEAGEEGVEQDRDGEAAPRMAAANPLPALPEDGRGVVVGVCDWGLDFTHPNFRNEDGTTRLLSLWDQRGVGHPLAPAPYNQGRLLTREAINAALETPDPFATLEYYLESVDPMDAGTHGTHVTDIVAGNRREPGSEVGLATAADIVFVHLAAPQLGELGTLGDSVGLLEGLDFCRRQAAGRPCVLHLSAGKTGGEKRGRSPLERAVDSMLKQPGVALVQSVGNYAHTAMHTQARVGPDQRHVINWIIPPNDRTPNKLEIWYSGEDVFVVTLMAPTGREFSVALDSRMRLEDGLTVWGNFYHRVREPNSGLNNVAIFLYPGAPSGMWRVAIHGRDVVDGRLHAWVERDASRRFQSRFLRAQATPRYTTNTICNCFRAIAVGAHDATQRSRPPTRFSSRGPTADGRQKPELSAPGYMVRAARSTPRAGWRDNESRLCVKSGTSMAAPWVSGTVALMMQAAGRPLTIYEIRRALIGSADPHPGPLGLSSSRLGYGYLNIAGAVAAARALARPDQQRTAVVREAESEEAGWAPVSLEDEVLVPENEDEVLVPENEDEVLVPEYENEVVVTEHETDAFNERALEQTIDAAAPALAHEECGCVRGKDRESMEEWTETATEEPQEEQIESPFGWEDVRDALEAFEQIEGPA